jgi:hypothetical protein
MLMLTRCGAVNETTLVEHLGHKGVDKYIAFEVPLDKVHKMYGVPFEIVAADIEHGNDMRILDYNGAHIFSSLDFSELGAPTMVEH